MKAGLKSANDGLVSATDRQADFEISVLWRSGRPPRLRARHRVHPSHPLMRTMEQLAASHRR